MVEETNSEMLLGLWAEYQSSPFPKGVGGKDVNGVDFVMLDADVAGCVLAYLDRGTLDVWRTAILGLSYHRCEFVLSILNEEASAYYWRLGRMAELVLEEIVKAGERSERVNSSR